MHCFVLFIMIEIKNSNIIHLAPLQGVTDKTYRSVFNSHINNVDFFYTPYLSLENNGAIKMLEDVVGLNDDIQFKTIPQILPNSLSELKILIKPIIKHGFQCLNINMGCPYPMVTRKGRGAALILEPEIVSDLINYVNDNTQLQISIKVRSGVENHNDIFTLIDQIPTEKIKKIIVHPRIAKQLYKGQADIKLFKKCCDLYPNANFIYNGDIRSYKDFISKKTILEEQREWMIGRGLIEDPFLAWQIKSLSLGKPLNFETKLQEFSIFLVESIKKDSKDSGHAINRCKHQFKLLFNGNERYRKIAKKIKKSVDIYEIEELINELKLI